MTKISADKIRKLRDATGAPVMRVKEVLEEQGGDEKKAEKILKKEGFEKASKRKDRETNQGVVSVYSHHSGKVIGVVELLCETDFVAKNDGFVALANELAKLALDFDSKDDFLNANYNGISVEEKLTEQTGVIGEKIEIGGFRKLNAPFVGSYIHAGNKIATLVGLSSAVEGAAVAAKDIAMQAAAMNPVALDESAVDQSVIDKEIEIAKDQLRQEGKPEAMLDNIAKGKSKRFFKDNTLVNQDFIKDSKQSVSQYIKSVNPDLKITGFERVALG